MGRSVRARPSRSKAVAVSIVHSAIAAGIAAGIVALTGIVVWIAVLMATAILVIGIMAWERL